MVRLPNLEAAEKCYHSPEYTEARKYVGTAERHMVAVEGLDKKATQVGWWCRTERSENEQPLDHGCAQRSAEDEAGSSAHPDFGRGYCAGGGRLHRSRRTGVASAC
ncbi:DUF1330 domain-containing protein [Bradyrhizobium sp. Ash2021]|uniref:DUF1330 domain-containing protein n=1 Tax=Bradyrhizobium sp. Ash2021 TaxID=2954771 RepID=UPI0035BFCC1E